MTRTRNENDFPERDKDAAPRVRWRCGWERGADSSPPSSELLGELDGPGAALVEAAVHGGGNARCAGDEGRFLVGEIDDAEADRAVAKEARGFLLEAVAERGVAGDDVAHDVAVKVGAAVELFRDVLRRRARRSWRR